MFEKSSEHLQNSLIMLEIGWKSFGNHCRPCFEVIENLSTHSVIVGSHRKIFGSCWKPLAMFGSLLKSLAVFRSCSVGKSSEIQILWKRKFSRILQKKSWQEYDWLFCLFFPVVQWDDWQIYCLSLMINDDWIHAGLYRIMFHVCSIWRPCTLWKN